MTRHNHSEAEPEPDLGRNVFLDKVAARFTTAAEALTSAAAALEGRDHVTATGLDDLRWAASSVARSMDAVDAIITHFAGALTTPGGNDGGGSDTRSYGLQELHLSGLVTAALAGRTPSEARS